MKRTTHELLNRLEKIGFTYGEAVIIRRIAMTFSRWGTLCCGEGNDYASWAIERDEETAQNLIDFLGARYILPQDVLDEINSWTKGDAQ